MEKKKESEIFNKLYETIKFEQLYLPHLTKEDFNLVIEQSKLHERIDDNNTLRDTIDAFVEVFSEYAHEGKIAKKEDWLKNKKQLVLNSLEKEPVLLIGSDCGGNNCRVIIESADGIMLGSICIHKKSHILDANNTWENIMEGIRKVLSPYGLEFPSKLKAYACFGLAGRSVPEYIARFDANPNLKLFHSLTILKDTEIAQAGAHNLGDGGIIIIGTGSAAYAKLGKDEYRSGGRGFPVSDEGSGAYIGLLAAKALMSALDSEGDEGKLTQELAKYKDFKEGILDLVKWGKAADPSNFSELAPIVIKNAKDPVAKRILEDAGNKIASLYDNIIAKIGKEIPFALLGGLASRIVDYLPYYVVKGLVPPAHSAVKGAVLIAKQVFEKDNGKS